MIKYSTPKTKVRKIKSTDPNFNITTDWIIYPRAAIHISQRCPDNYKNLIEECVKHGWIQPVAYMSEREMLFVGLSGNNQEAQN
jgi:hypothetical protein